MHMVRYCSSLSGIGAFRPMWSMARPATHYQDIRVVEMDILMLGDVEIQFRNSIEFETKSGSSYVQGLSLVILFLRSYVSIAS